MKTLNNYTSIVTMYIFAFMTLLLISNQLIAQCSIPNPDFCPGNYFTNGNFENTTGNLSAPSNDINLADGWAPIWGTGSLADLACGNTVHGNGTTPPTPNQGVYAGMWIMNRTGSANATYREGMYNKLASPISSSGSYTFTFDMASALSNYSGPPVNIAFYGVYNPSDIPATTPTGQNTPSNLNLWSSVPGVEITHLGTVASPSVFTNNWSSHSFTFNSGQMPPSGITHILITKDDAPVSWRNAYVNFDNFCLQVAENSGGCTDCCKTPLDIFNASGTPNPLPVVGSVFHGTALSTAKETFEIHANATIPITELSVSVTDIQYNYNYDACLDCVNNPALWGTLISPTATIGTNGLSLQTPPYAQSTGSLVDNGENVREIVWSNPFGAMLTAGDQFDVHYILPPASEIPCCAISVKICTVIRYKDANCNVCEIPTCSVIELSNDQQNPSCSCGEYKTKRIRVTGLKPASNSTSSVFVQCGGNKRGELKSSTLSFSAPIFECKGDNCPVTYKWVVTRKGTVVGQGQGRTFRHAFNDLSYTDRYGEYTVTCTPICGGKECDPCTIDLRLRKKR